MSEIIGEAQIIIRADTAPFLTQLEELRALARKPIVTPVSVIAKQAGTATITGTTAQTTAAAELAGAQAISAETTAKATAASRAQAAQAAETARKMSQLEKGVASTTLTQFGLRGATLAASVSFIAGAATVTALSRILKSSVDVSENFRVQMERLKDTVGNLTATDVSRWAAGLATNFGLARDQGVQFAATLEGLFKNFGISSIEATTMSERLVQLAADMAAFKGQGTTTTEALTALQRGLAGNGRALRTFNVFVDQGRVAQEALNETGKKQTSELTRQEIVLARYNLIIRDTANQVGAFKDRSNELSVQSAILGANLRNLEIAIGGPLVTALTSAAEDVNILIRRLKDLEKIKPIEIPVKIAFNAGGGGGGGITGLVRETIKSILIANPVVPGGSEFILLRTINDLIQTLSHSNDQLATSSTSAGAAMKDTTGAVRGLSGIMGVLGVNTQDAAAKLNDAANAAGRVAAATLRAQAASPTGELTPQQQIAQSTADIAAQQKIVAASKSGSKKRNDALRAIAQDKRDRTNAQKQIASEAVDQANQAKTAAQKAQDASDAADQAIIKAIGGGETKLTDQLILAGPKKTIAIDKQIVQFFKDAIKRVRETVKNAQTAADEISVLTTAMLNAVKQLKSDQAARDQAVADAAQSAADARQTHLEALLSIAETTPGTRDDVKRLNAIIDFDNKRIEALKKKRHKTQQEKAELDALRVDLAQRRQALRNLVGEQKKNLTAQAEFNFLQTQTGFVSNLLGNLIPGGATAGLVGGGGPSVPSNVRPAGQLSAAQTTSQANLVRPFTSGQGETQTNILRHILAELHRLNTGNEHPEAHKQRRTGAAVMDFQSPTPGF